jgi:hypothetical protein
MAHARTRLAIGRSDSVVNKLGVMAYNSFGWIHVVSTSQIIPSSQRLSTPCFAGILMRLIAISICQTFQGMHLTLMTRPISWPGSRHFVKADGSLGAGHFKRSLPRNQLNFCLKTGSNWVTRYPWGLLSTR